ncbi:hypothetical protein M422DRAFT_251530 [Sphaerobolus stellatus SS14]|uniref:Uncharacterized protein n=1 Tax=Sphaerobolus stellatus (strain SS14) TaxID=990650 RepID=A0A0C9W1V0_SPHS4|nr:hypothetical protein M422DRAFT_251530 [Sphaerobolus stellatus SS14]
MAYQSPWFYVLGWSPEVRRITSSTHDHTWTAISNPMANINQQRRRLPVSSSSTSWVVYGTFTMRLFVPFSYMSSHLSRIQHENHTRGAPNRLQSRSAGKSSQIVPPCLTPLLALSVESYLRSRAITFLRKLSSSCSLCN